MSREILLSILLYYFLIIFQNRGTTATSLTKSTENKNHQEVQFYHESLSRKNKRDLARTPGTDPKSYYLKKLTESFYRYKNPKLNYLLSKSWGAQGMPFNVLYSPNSYQQKLLKSLPKKKYQIGTDEKEKFSKTPKKIPEAYDLVLDDEKPLLKFKEKLVKPFTPRKYYSLIPQLFVSHGW